MRIPTLAAPLTLAALVTLGAGGCAPSVILEHPGTKQRVDCTVQAARLVAALPLEQTTGTDVPRPQPTSPAMARFDYERQCRGNLEREGFVCLSGC